ncbi:MAG: exopolysaccharide biosynthesis polyprenyl glycosylphosphotransferase [Planctomycetes bacterium]|nr:exopolysaccharide biosynthesis polyprenyl glycosylphosphotransferase [Planctomycetota bacterium]
MLAARLKNIFLSLLTVELGSATVALVLGSVVLYRLRPLFPGDPVPPLLFLIALFVLCIFTFLLLFYQRLVGFRGFEHSIAWAGFLQGQTALLILGGGMCLLALGLADRHTVVLLIGFTATTMFLLAVGHLAAITLLSRMYCRPANRLRILVMGMNHRTRDFCQVLQSTPHLGTKLRGYLDVQEYPDAGLPYCGPLDRLDDLLHSEVIDVVFIFLPVRSYYDAIHQAIETAGFYGVTAYIVGNLFDTETTKKRPLCIADFGSMAFSSTSVDYVGLGIKRIADILLAAAALVVLSPLLAGIALFIKLSAGGPVLFRQERIGYNKRSFTMFKFRTMVPDAEKRLEEVEHLNEMDGAGFKITRDPRLIRGGSFLRRYSLDELPQLWNVLRGDMSLVGPRPLSRRDFDLLEEDWQRKRFSMRPGLTCIWQVEGRNSVTFPEWMAMDLDYIDRWSLWLDAALIFRTFGAVLGGKGK